MTRFQTTLLLLIAVAVLYAAQAVFVPLVLAALLAMLLRGPVRRLERWRVPRVVAVTGCVLVAAGLIVGIGYLVWVQVGNLADNLPRYQAEIRQKAKAIRQSGAAGGRIKALQDLGASIATDAKAGGASAASRPTTGPAATGPAASGPSTGTAAAAAATQPGVAAAAALQVVAPPGPTEVGRRPVGERTRDLAAAAAATQPAAGPPDGTEESPLFVYSLPAPETTLAALSKYLGLALGPLGTAGIVIVFVFFILLEREDLRDRAIRLVSNGRLTVTTTAVDDGITRVLKFLRAQALVNGTYGLAVAVGLCAISLALAGKGEDSVFPSFVIWGILACVLRFIPYVGPWIASAFPVTLSLAAYHGFGVFAAVLGLFLVIELLSNNVMEPMLYGATTGLSTMAILVSAIFWTWLWGPVGLVLSTPLTVVMLVVGKHVPPLRFLEVLLGDRPAMTPPERAYQRLLAGDEDEAYEVAAGRLADAGLAGAFDAVVLPALAMSEADTAEGLLDEDRELEVRQGMRRLIDALAQAATDAAAEARAAAAKADAKAAAESDVATAGPVADAAAAVRVAILPAHDEGDELAGLMLAHVLRLRGLDVLNVSHNALAAEVVDAVVGFDPHAVLISATPPAAVSHVRYLLRRLSGRLAPDRMTIAVWAAKSQVQTLRTRLGLNAMTLAVSLPEAEENIRRLTEGVRGTAVTGG